MIERVVAKLFGAPDGDHIDVVALSCTHFPLLRAELAAAAPRECLWLDSGAAIARRVCELIQPEAGLARAHRAAFTDAASAHELREAFENRGFQHFLQIIAAPDFVLAPLGAS